jgi:signal transduction histidine kinase
MMSDIHSLKHRAVVLFSWFGIVFSIGFTFVNIKRGIVHVALVDAGMLLAFTANLITYRRDLNTARAGGIGLSIIMAFVLIAMGSLGVAALAWIYIIPTSAFFFMGLKVGRRFVAFWGLAILGMFLFFDSPPGMHIGLKLEMFTVFALASVVAQRLEQLRDENERQIRELAREAQKANETKDQFLAQMSHELRTPLNAILGFSQIMAHKPTLPTDLEPYLEKIRTSGTDLLGMVDSILDYAKLKTGTMECVEEEVSVCGVIEETIEACRSAAEIGKIELSADGFEEISLLADRRLVKEALERLLLHAVRRAAPGGEVSITCRAREGLRLTVANSGEMIGEQNLPSDSDPFELIGDPDRPTAIDLSLGLAIVQLVAAAHDGWVEMESEPDCGSCITMILPESRILSRSSAETRARTPEKLPI